MAISEFFSKNISILEYIFNDDAEYDINSRLIDEIGSTLQNLSSHHLNDLSRIRDHSFQDNAQYNTPIDAFNNFLKRIEKIPDEHQVYLLCLATLNCDGYIREEALHY